MKKTLALFYLLMPCLLAAQIPAGTYFIGASSGMRTYSQIYGNSTSSKTTNLFGLNPTQVSFGKFVSDKNAFSVLLLGSINSSNFSNLDYNYTAGLGFGYTYVIPMDEKWGFMLSNEISGTFGRAKLEKEASYTVNLYKLNASVSPGMYVLLFDQFMLQANFNVFDLEIQGAKSEASVPNNEKVLERHSIKINGVLPRGLDLLSFNFGLNYLLLKK
ncbi:MAG: hypothetical protein CFE21_14135 [Bacteroidetes bacterium B1(2017)]|nr:MAG: hypothetical protein CFE21_14135 [Bacteroidetes bacterium B1(2017)]